MMTKLFAGKAAFVTGGGSGIGAATALRFAQEGAAVLVVDRDLERAEGVAQSIRQGGGRAAASRCDIASEEDNHRAVALCVEQFGRLDAAFLNAGIYDKNPAEAPFDLAVFDRVLSINLRGTALGLKAVLDVIQPGGAAVVTASASGVTGLPIAAGYTASKHGVIGLVKAVTQAFVMRGARVNAICPGFVLTPMNGATEAPPLSDPDQLPIPEYRGALMPQHVAELALFLASPRSAGLMGQAVMVDAGYGVTFPPVD